MNDFIVYGNVNAKGWKVLTTTTSRDRLENILHVIMDSKENIQVIVVYSMSDRDIPLCSFNNKIQREIYSLDEVELDLESKGESDD